MSDIQNAITVATALADAAVAREKYKRLLVKRRESGDTCSHDYEDLKVAYKASKRRYRVCLATYTSAKEASR